MLDRKLLTLIENADPADNKALDEIDARVWEFIGPEKHKPGEIKYPGLRPSYTASRDAIKIIRPEGWITSLHNSIIMRTDGPQKWQCQMSMFENVHLKERCAKIVFSGDCNSEELAELHAIIQAIEFERGSV